jgi:V-type H+-transporting ATPase subunit C
MSWFFLATPLGKSSASSDSAAFKEIQTNIIGTGSKASGDINAVKFDKSKFKIGTLDQLVKLNDALVKVDLHLESIIKKIQKQSEEISSDLKLKIETSDSTLEMSDYIQSFQWDDTKFPRSRALVDIAQIISEKMNSIDGDMKKYLEEYNILKASLPNSKKDEGTFLSKDLGDTIYGKVDKKNFILGSKYMRNVVIVVPKNKVDYFNKNYELVGEGIVPRSARDLEIEDKDSNHLMRVIVMENSADSFLYKCKQKIHFTAKMFDYDEEKYQHDLEEAKVIEGKLNKLVGKLEKRCYYSFSELYVASIHLKTMRTYIDGVLRFGIPPKFLLTVVNAKSGYDKKILKQLTDQFADGKMKDMYGTKEEIGDTEDFFPFVYVQISITS